MSAELFEKVEEAEKKLAELKVAAFEARKLPDFWRIGQKVRMLKTNDWAWNKGDVMTVMEFHDSYPEASRPAAEYQVFFTGGESNDARFWTTPDDVELVEDV